MKRARFTEEQIGFLQEHEAGPKTSDLAREARRLGRDAVYLEGQYRGMDVPETKRLRQLEDENAKLKELLAEQLLDAPPFASFWPKKW